MFKIKIKINYHNLKIILNAIHPSWCKEFHEVMKYSINIQKSGKEQALKAKHSPVTRSVYFIKYHKKLQTCSLN